MKVCIQNSMFIPLLTTLQDASCIFCLFYFNHFSQHAGKNFNINHFDLKCDNILIWPLDSRCSQDELINQSSDSPNFAVCLAGVRPQLFFFPLPTLIATGC